jgi:hypothetical protein
LGTEAGNSHNKKGKGKDEVKGGHFNREDR